MISSGFHPEEGRLPEDRSRGLPLDGTDLAEMPWAIAGLIVYFANSGARGVLSSPRHRRPAAGLAAFFILSAVCQVRQITSRPSPDRQ
jgi:hypothetical protein